MVTKIVKIGFIFILLAALYGCGAAYYSDQYSLNKNPLTYAEICADFFTHEAYVQTMAYEYCSKGNMVPKIKEVSYFTDCSLFSPVVYEYNCVQNQSNQDQSVFNQS